jgi:DNA-binding transcriptional LysR family regulator
MKVKAKAVLGQLSDMDFRLLQVFKSVADCGGMAAAGLELNIGISTVSRHVKDLETRLQMTLCSRGRGGFALTAEGERIYQETQRLLASADAFRASVDDIHQRMGGQLHVAVFDKTASNPAAKISEAIALFAEQAPDVALNFHVATINMIERGVIDGRFQVGIIPQHRSSDSLLYDRLFGETMLLYCGARHPLFGQDNAALDWDSLRRHQFAGLGYHSPNMEISQQVRLPRKATGFDQESIATLILSGCFLGFLPDHYAQGFVADGKMRAVHPQRFRYDCDFVAILRGSPQPSRIASAFRECLLAAHRTG